MKKYLLIAGAFCMVAIPPAAAVVKCVALKPGETTCRGPSLSPGTAEWTTTCTTNGTNVPVSGIIGCSSVRGSYVGATVDELPTDVRADETVYCWCKMTSPAVSKWTYRTSWSDAENCLNYCAPNCANAFWTTDGFSDGMFSSLYD